MVNKNDVYIKPLTVIGAILSLIGFIMIIDNHVLLSILGIILALLVLVKSDIVDIKALDKIPWNKIVFLIVVILEIVLSMSGWLCWVGNVLQLIAVILMFL